MGPRRGSAPCLGVGSLLCPPRATLPGRNSRPGCSLEIIPSPLGSLGPEAGWAGGFGVLGANRPPLCSPVVEAPCKGAALGKPLLSHVFIRGGQPRPSAGPRSRGRGSRGEGRALLLLRPRPPRVRPTPLTGGDPRPCRGGSGKVQSAV